MYTPGKVRHSGITEKGGVGTSSQDIIVWEFLHGMLVMKSLPGRAGDPQCPCFIFVTESRCIWDSQDTPALPSLHRPDSKGVVRSTTNPPSSPCLSWRQVH